MAEIKQVQLGNDVYDLLPKYIQDTSGTAKVWGDIVDLVSSARLAIRVVTTLPTASADTTGAIYLIAETGVESGTYVEYITVTSTATPPTYSWEKIGTTATDLTDYVKKNTTYTDAAVSDGAHTHTVSGSVTVPTVTHTTKYVGATATGTAVSAPTSNFVTSYPGAISHLSTTSLKGVAGTTTVSSVTNAGTKTNGTAAAWGATVTNGVLSFSWTANTPTAVTLPTFSAVTVATANANATTLATGELASTATGGAVLIGLGTASTAKAVTGVTVSAQPTITLNTSTASATGKVSLVDTVTVGSGTASLTNGAAASNGAHTHDVKVNS